MKPKAPARTSREIAAAALHDPAHAAHFASLFDDDPQPATPGPDSPPPIIENSPQPPASGITQQPAPRATKATPAPKATPKHHDKTQPLQNARYEQMVKLVVDGYTQQDAYTATAKGKVSPDTAKVRASKIFATDEVASRRNWLTMEAKLEAKQPEKTTAPPKTSTERQPSNRDDSQPITQQELAHKVTTALRATNDPRDIASLTATALKVAPGLAETSTAKPDPAAVVAYVASFAGNTGPQIIAELGGWRLLAEMLCDCLKCDLETISAQLNALRGARCA